MPVLEILRDQRSVYSGEFSGSIELGRQQKGETELFSPQPAEEGTRLAIAPLDETKIGRRQLVIREVEEGKVRLANHSRRVTLDVQGSHLEPSGACTVTLPVTILLPAGLTVNLKSETTTEHLHDLGEETTAPGRALDTLASMTVASSLLREAPDAEQLVRALQATMDLFQSALTKEELFESAIRGAVELAGFDRGQVLLLERGSWTSASNDDAFAQTPASQTVLRSVADKKRTFWDAGELDVEAESLAGTETVIAAPILDGQGKVVGALYCDRHQRFNAAVQPITRLDARVVELLACGVASGLARMRQEQSARRYRTQFEQFFTAELARELDLQPNLLAGRDADVSVLFCDIRSFSRISERIGTQATFEWINDVMGVLSECVAEHQGVLVDYIGDELMAMWGAPKPQDDHAARACRAALAMLAQLPDLNDKWEERLEEPLSVGVGVNSGPVRAGNAGSKQKFKYGPLGNTVNLASRVQGATKHLKNRLLVTGSTADQLGEDFFRRKLASVRVVNIDEPVHLWELQDGDSQPDLYERFGLALTAFEQAEFAAAARLLSDLLADFPNDGPSLVLLKRVVNALVDGPHADHPVWTLPSK